MAGRPTQIKADIEKIKQLQAGSNDILDYRPIIAYTMRACGCTFTEIGEVFGFTRQMAETMVKNAETKLKESKK